MKYKNEEDFLYMDNYKALLACILSEISVDKAVRIVALQKVGNKGSGGGIDLANKEKYKKHKRRYVVGTYVLDTVEDKVIKFRSSSEASRVLGITRPTISKSIDKGNVVKKRYIFTSYDPKETN